jgi:hypothetical protein
VLEAEREGLRGRLRRWEVGSGREAVRLERTQTFRVELGVQVGMLGFEPFFAFLCCAAEFTVLCECILLVFLSLDLVSCSRWLSLPLGEGCRL